MPEQRPPLLGVHEAETRFACGCQHRWDTRMPWDAEERALLACETHGGARIGFWEGKAEEWNPG